MRLGCIDIGSNTTRLLVAETDGRHLLWIHEERAFTRIGLELVAGTKIGIDKIAEVVAVVDGQLASARAHGATGVRGVATAAIRAAENGGELVAEIHGACGLPVEILSEQEEARLAFVGVIGTLERPPAGELGVVDVGGGSSELVIGSVSKGVRWWRSIRLGSGALTYTCLRCDPPTPAQLTTARRRIAATLAEIKAPRPRTALAVGGSATSLSRLAGPLLDAPSLHRALDLLGGEPSSLIARRFTIDDDRARLLPAGLLILEGVAGLLGTTLRVGHGGIREGVLLEAGRGYRAGQ